MKDFLKKHKGRFAAIVLSTVTCVLFYILKGNKQLMTNFVDNVTGPFKRFSAHIFSFFPISGAELLLVGAALFVIFFIFWTVVSAALARNDWAKVLASKLVTAVTLVALVAASMNVMWSTNYYAASFKERSGINAQGCTVEELHRVTVYFAELVNESAVLVKRDKGGIYTTSIDDVLDETAILYRPLETEFTFLSGRELVPRGVFLSEVMSMVNTSGVTFPLTGESCVNVHAPACFIPVTAAHEVAHQRNIASEDEANFVAVLACLESDNPDFSYSGSLLAFTVLSNALYSADYKLWAEVRVMLCDSANIDLRANSAYWYRYDTSVSEFTDNLYDSFLKERDQPLGIKSYGAAANLLVEYFKGIA